MPITEPGLTHSAILGASPIPTSVMDAAGTIIYVNPAFLAYASKLRGKEIRREDRIGRNVWERMVTYAIPAMEVWEDSGWSPMPSLRWRFGRTPWALSC